MNPIRATLTLWHQGSNQARRGNLRTKDERGLAQRGSFQECPPRTDTNKDPLHKLLSSSFSPSPSFDFFETGPQYIAQTDLELTM
jgi:hypothetical protein